MDKNAAKSELKKQLLAEVARFYRHDGRQWKEPIVETLRDLRHAVSQAVFFGGTLRSLLISRVYRNKVGRPRDVDIVVSGTTVEQLRERFQDIISRETRFGGLQLRRRDWQFDMWPLQQTWAFVRDSVTSPVFAGLPSTTFLNLEAIAVEVWPQPGRARQIFSGDDQFFDGILTRTLEINRETNPYPELCVVRAILMGASLDFRIGPQLARYIATFGADLAADQLDDIQHKHYGMRHIEGRQLIEWIARIGEMSSCTQSEPIQLPIPKQQHFWPSELAPHTVLYRASRS